MYIAVDFDGTCVTHAFPHIGKEIGAAPVLRYLAQKHKLILFTMRCNTLDPMGYEYPCLNDACSWFKKHDIPLFGVNDNPKAHFSTSPKVYADMYIDDRALGIPLREVDGGMCVDWEKCLVLLLKMGLIDNVDFQSLTKQVIDEREV
jgi:hypothetical protein